MAEISIEADTAACTSIIIASAVEPAAEQVTGPQASGQPATGPAVGTNESLVLCLGRLLLRVLNGQSEPLWPALAEVPVPIDLMGFDVPSLDVEYVLWAN